MLQLFLEGQVDENCLEYLLDYLVSLMQSNFLVLK